MGEELELGGFYLQTPDGKMIPWNGITTAEVVSKDDPQEDSVYASLRQCASFEGSIALDMTRRENKKLRKWMKTLSNKLMRRKRYYCRQKEYARRRKLKGARYV